MNQKEQAIWQRVLAVNSPDCLSGEKVQQMIAHELADAETYARLACCTQGCCRQTLQKISREERCHARQLETVYFLMTGRCAELCAAQAENGSGTLCARLRARFSEEQNGARAYREAAGRSEQFRELFTHLAADEARHAELLRGLLCCLL